MSHLLTDQAERVMQLAAVEAERFNHEYISTEHILLALVREGTGVIANVLNSLHVDQEMIRVRIETVVQAGPYGERVVTGRLSRTPRANSAINYAAKEAHDLGHGCVGPEHLLLGLMREWEGIAAQVLINLGVRLEDAREQVYREGKRWWQVSR